MKYLYSTLLSFIAFYSFCQTTTGQFVTATNTSCKVWSEVYSPEESATWSGSCKDGYADGKGVLNWYAGNKLIATYTGYLTKGNPNGKGRYTVDGYGVMEGVFSQGLLNGKGAIYLANGGKMIGNFSHGEFLNLDAKYLSLLQTHTVAIKDTAGIYNNGVNGLHYMALVPKSTIKAVLVLFPSTGESVANVVSCNKQLMQQCYNQGILSVVLSSNYNKTLESDAFAMAFFDRVFDELVTKFNAPKDKFILMGLSLGGENALQYTEMSRNAKYKTYLKPLAVVGVDPPVDMVDLYQRAKKQIVIYEKEGDKLSESKQIALNENRFLIDYFHTTYGGPPEEFPERYYEGSCFLIDHVNGGNAQYLIDVPVRLYCDPDILWQLKNKGRDYYEMNASSLSAMINFLMQNGNKRAEFIPALGKGYRVDGLRHPHSWSIVAPADCVKWILALAK